VRLGSVPALLLLRLARLRWNGLGFVGPDHTQQHPDTATVCQTLSPSMWDLHRRCGVLAPREPLGMVDEAGELGSPLTR
jgi:hypothetical protein